jgi:hypothetical protein
MTSISLQSRVSVAHDQISCDLSGEVVILHVGSGQYFGLNPVGARIWQLLGDGRTLVDVRDVLLGEYDVDPDRCTSELLGVVADLVQADLARVDC